MLHAENGDEVSLYASLTAYHIWTRKTTIGKNEKLEKGGGNYWCYSRNIISRNPRISVC